LSDEFTLGEVRRNLHEHEQRSVEQHRALDERITSLAGHSVTDVVYQLDKAATVEMARRLERDRVEGERKLREDVIGPALVRITALETVNATRPTMTFTTWVALLTLAATFLGVLVTVWATSKGAK
jgi:hypothetical protein